MIMRYRCYETLRDLGRDTFYSVTITSNKPSWRFKQKLGANAELKDVAVEFRKHA